MGFILLVYCKLIMIILHLLCPHCFLRRGIALACLGGPIYALGGLDDTVCFNIVERYDQESDCWSTVQPMNMRRGGVAVVAYRVSVF